MLYCLAYANSLGIKMLYGGVIVSALISIAYVGLVVWFNMVKGMHLPMILYAGLFPCWLMFFVIGIALGQRTDRNYHIFIPVVITLVGLVLSVYGSNYLYNHYSTGVGIKPSALIFSHGVILLLFSSKAENFISKGGVIFKTVVFIGELSFGIYLTHCYVLRLVSRLQINSWFIRFSLAIGITIIFIITLRKLNSTRYHKFLGI